MSDLISKRELYYKISETYKKGRLSWGANEIFKDIIGECDSVENKGDLISRQAVLDAIQKLNIPEDMCVFEIISHIELAIATLPSVVIRDATSEERESVDNYIKSISTKTGRKFDVPSVENKGWNPLKSDEEGMIIGSLPEEGKEVFITVYGHVEIDSFGCDFEYDESVGDYRNKWFCENNDIEDVRAWMPLPEPYKEERG